MTAPQIGVVGERHDDEVLALSRALRERGARVRVLDFTGLPGAHRLQVADADVRFNGRSLATLQGVYIRRLRRLPAGSDSLATAADGAEWRVALDAQLALQRQEREVIALIWSALQLLDAPLVNELEAQLVHPRKLHHLRTLAAAGVPVPELLAANDREALAAFAAELGDGGAVVKPVRGILKTTLLADVGELPVTERPVLLQRLVAGVTVRVYAVAGRPVAAGEMRNAGHVDSSVDPRPVQLVELTEAEATLVARATRAARLPFSGVDLQRPTAGGPTQILECNAAPMFANFCRRTGADVAGALADYLLFRARGGEVWPAADAWREEKS